MADPLLPPLADPAELAGRLGDERLRVVFVGSTETFAKYHVPGATHAPYATLVAGGKPAPGKVPSRERLAQALGWAGITPETHVAAYDEEGGAAACRLLWTLALVRHPGGMSLLDGGLHAWANEGHPLEQGPPVPPPGAPYPVGEPDDSVTVEADAIVHRLGEPELALLDARTPEEYRGEKVRAARGGHIPGAVNIDWVRTLDRQRNLRLLPAETLRALYADAGVTPDREVVTYCHTHHRSSHTWFVLRLLGYPRVRGYPGSWSEWGNRPDLPVER